MRTHEQGSARGQGMQTRTWLSNVQARMQSEKTSYDSLRSTSDRKQDTHANCTYRATPRRTSSE